MQAGSGDGPPEANPSRPRATPGARAGKGAGGPMKPVAESVRPRYQAAQTGD